MKYNLQKYLASLMKITNKVNSIATIQSESTNMTVYSEGEKNQTG